MSKFPPLPNTGHRPLIDPEGPVEVPPSPAPSVFPFGPPHSVKDSNRLTDEEALQIMRQYLRKDQLDQPKILKFIMAYLECRSQAQAAREAGMDGKGSYLRSRPEIHAVIEALTAKAVMKFGYDASEVIERVKEISNFDPIEFENPDGSYKTHLSLISPEARRAIKKFKAKNIYGQDANGMQTVIGQIMEIEVWDKLKSHELLGREKNIMKQTTVQVHDVTSNMKDVLLASRRRGEIAAREVIELNPGGDNADREEKSGSGDGSDGSGARISESE